MQPLGLVGKFPLRAWTENILKVALPDDRTGEPSKEARLTGEKCLHYCRHTSARALNCFKWLRTQL